MIRRLSEMSFDEYGGEGRQGEGRLSDGNGMFNGSWVQRVQKFKKEELLG
jgi:hypothetical protein